MGSYFATSTSLFISSVAVFGAAVKNDCIVAFW